MPTTLDEGLQSGQRLPASWTRTIADAVNEVTARVFSVKDSQFGAIGDGVTDDTAAIQAAQTAAGDTGVLFFPPGVYKIIDTIAVGNRCAWRGGRTERGCNAQALAAGTYHSVKILFRPTDTTKYLVSKFDATDSSSVIGPFFFADLAFDVGDANGFEFGRESLGYAGQRFVFGVSFKRCALLATNANRASDTNGVITRSGRYIFWLTKAFESSIDDCSFQGGDTQVRTFACDAVEFRGEIRSQLAHLPFDLNGSGSAAVQHKLDGVQVEGWTFTPLRMAALQVNGDLLRFEQIAADAGIGRYALTPTAAVTAGSATLTFSASMNGILWPGLSIIELTDGTNTDTALVDTVSGTTVTVLTDGFAFGWSAAAATVTRIHGYGPIKIGAYDVGVSNVQPQPFASTPSFVMAHSKGQFSICNAAAPVGGTNRQRSMVIANRHIGQSFLNPQMVFAGCSPQVIADPAHPLVHVIDWRPRHGPQTDASGAMDINIRYAGGALADEQSLIQRAWAWSPKSGATSVNNWHLTPFVPVAGDVATPQLVWAWEVAASSSFGVRDRTLPSSADKRLRVRLRARAKTTGATANLIAIGVGANVTIGSVTLTTAWQTFEFIIDVPTCWTSGGGRVATTDTLIQATFSQIWYCAALDVVEMLNLDNRQVSTNNGDAAKTLTVGTSETTQRWATPLTADRAVTLSTTGAYNGAMFRIVRQASSTGAFNLNLGTGPLKALATGTWAEVTYNGSAWMLTAYGAL